MEFYLKVLSTITRELVSAYQEVFLLKKTFLVCNCSITSEHTQLKNCMRNSVKRFLETEIQFTQNQLDSSITPSPSLEIYLQNIKEQLSDHVERESAEAKYKHKLADFSNPQSPSKEFNASPPDPLQLSPKCSQ